MVLTVTDCPECHQRLHEGQHKYADGIFEVWYCKKCGFRKEILIESKLKDNNIR